MSTLNIKKVTEFPLTPIANAIYIKKGVGDNEFEIKIGNSTGTELIPIKNGNYVSKDGDTIDNYLTILGGGWLEAGSATLKNIYLKNVNYTITTNSNTNINVRGVTIIKLESDANLVIPRIYETSVFSPYSTLTYADIGFTARVVFKQDVVGGRIVNWVTFASPYQNITWIGGSAPIINTLPEEVTTIEFFWDGENLYGWKVF